MNKLSKFVVTTILCVSFCSSASVYAYKISADTVDTKIKINGSDAILKDSNNTTIKPIKYNNNLYVPLKQLLDILKIPFNYNTKANIAYIGQKPYKSSLIDYCLPKNYLDNTIDPDILTCNKQKYKFGLYKVGIMCSPYTNDSQYELDKNYTNLNCKVYNPGTYTVNLKLIDIDRNLILRDINISQQDGLKNIDIDVSGVKTLTIRALSNSYSESRIVIAEPYLK